ncbi:MAG: ATP-dependent helicase HrpB [Proteobacteria bacterium]|nr:MAG: ATP-dependent helicase HrpB [Pseudomonadota bacterium]
MQYPVDPYLPDIAKALSDHAAALLKAEPGAGKTTQVPLYLLQHFKKILVIEPRRLAAKLSAEWVAQQSGAPLGDLVGYQVRLDSKRSHSTRLLYVTEGILTRLIMSDPMLSDFDLIILDEFHERHVQSDIALALVKKLQERRKDLKLLVMSATLEQTILQSYLGQVPSFDIPGRVFPVTVSYRPSAQGTAVPQQVAGAVQDMLKDPGCQGNILVFLAGTAQIFNCASYLDGRVGDAEIIPLSAEYAGNYQSIVANPSRRKIILSTNVAETSLTLPNVQGVIDLGTARILAYAPWSGLPTLEEKKISQASCVQRSGRAGRVAAGVCYRLFGESDFFARTKFSEPEIQRIDLCQIILELQSIYPDQAWGWDTVDWLERPKSQIIEQNKKLLQNLRAIDEKGFLTEDGRRMANLALHPRLSRLWIEAEKLGLGELGLLSALIINEGMLLGHDQRPEEHLESDVVYQLQIFLDWVRKKPRRMSLDVPKLQRILKSYDMMGRSLRLRSASQVQLEREEDLRFAIFSAFADRVAKYRPLADTGRNKLRHYNFSLGRGAVLSDASASQNVEWLVAVEARESYNEELGRIFVASGVSIDFLMRDPFALIERLEETRIDPKAGRPRLCKQLLYGKLLVEEVWEDAKADHAQDLLMIEVRKKWPACFEDEDALAIYHRKLALMDKHGIDHNMPHFEGEMLDLLIDHVCEGVRSFKELVKRSLGQAIREQLDYQDLELLNRACPDTVALKAGRKLKVNYVGEDEPWVASLIQDFYGQSETPSICLGRNPLVLKLLAPSQRPAQITRDLKNFWLGSYHEVKKELKRRYPKRAWPEDPETFVMPKREDLPRRK